MITRSNNPKVFAFHDDSDSEDLMEGWSSQSEEESEVKNKKVKAPVKSTTTRNLISWSTKDRKIITSAFNIWEIISKDYDKNELKEAIARSTIKYPNEKSPKRRAISALFFDSIIDPTRVYSCFSNSKIKVSTEESWKHLIAFYTKGHTFGEKEFKIIFKANAILKDKFIQLGINYNSAYCKNLVENKIDREEEKKSPVSSDNPNKPLKKRIKYGTSTSPDRESDSNEITPPIKKRPIQKPVQVITEAPKSITSNEPGHELILKLINFQLKNCKKIEAINWKWVAQNKEENIEKVRSIFDKYLVENNPLKNSDDPLMFYTEVSMDSLKCINWNWVADGMKSEKSQPTAEECQLMWQQQVYEALKK